MNLRAEDLASGVLRDRVKVGASLADVDPMNLDTSVSLVKNIYIYVKGDVHGKLSTRHYLTHRTFFGGFILVSCSVCFLDTGEV